MSTDGRFDLEFGYTGLSFGSRGGPFCTVVNDTRQTTYDFVVISEG